MLASPAQGGEGTQTFFLSHFLEVVGADEGDARFGFVGGLLLHVDLKVLLAVLEGSLLWAVFPAGRRTLGRSGTEHNEKLHGETKKKKKRRRKKGKRKVNLSTAKAEVTLEELLGDKRPTSLADAKPISQ